MAVQEVNTRFKAGRFCSRLFKGEEVYISYRLLSPDNEKPVRGSLHIQASNGFFSYKVDSLKFEKPVLAYNPYNLEVRKGLLIPAPLTPIIGTIHLLGMNPLTRDGNAVFELLAHKIEMVLGFDLTRELLSRPDMEWGERPTPELTYSEVMAVEAPQQLYKSPVDIVETSRSYFDCRIPNK